MPDADGASFVLPATVPLDELGRQADEAQHEVNLTQAFYVGIFEVTQGQWERVMGQTPAFFLAATRPVELVSYEDIRGSGADAGGSWPQNTGVAPGSFLGILRAKAGLPSLDLPTEAQREYACRAGTQSALNTGLELSGDRQAPEMDTAGRY